MRLIDADALLEIFTDRLAKVAERYGYDSAVTGAVSGAMKLISYFPSAQSEQKIGKWVALNKDAQGYTRTYECSECRSLVMKAMVIKKMDYEYCPYCGNKLEGEE